ncbi:MAG: prepilin-type N-terminal cleavage/methylation domain-containing protein [Armatimonadota bacterium]
MRLRQRTRIPAPQRSAQGLTLIEILVVIVVVAVLAAIVIPRIMPSKRGAKESALKADLQRLRTAVAMFHAHTGTYPAQLSDIVAPTAPATGLDEDGNSAPIPTDSYQGPYLVTPDGGIVPDPITGAADWVYSTTPPNVGAVHSSAAGDSLDGSPYSTL